MTSHEFLILWFTIASVSILAAVACWSRMEIQKYLSSSLPEINEEDIQGCVMAMRALCIAIQKAKEPGQQ